MDEHFTNNAETAYLASVTQSKKILFLQRQLANSQSYCKALQQNLEASKLTINRLIKQRTNHEVLAKMSQNLYGLERRYRQTQELLKQNNGKLLIQMQLRIQQKAEYSDKIKELEQSIELIRKTNKDKQQQFAIVVNKLRKYEDIRQLMMEEKILSQPQNNAIKNMLHFKEEDKELIIKQLSEELNFYRKFINTIRPDIDKKLSILLFALENQRNFNSLKQQLANLFKNGVSISHCQQLTRERVAKFKKIQVENSKMAAATTSSNEFKNSAPKLNECTKQLVKQLKKLVISNKILQSALNESLQKNQQLILNNQILVQSNLELKQEINEYKKRQKLGYRFGEKTNNVHSKRASFISNPHENLSTTHNRSNTKSQHKILDRYSRNYNPKSQIIEVCDDFQVIRDHQTDIPEMVWQRKLKQYLLNLKSGDYQVNVESLYKDVHRMSEFLMLSLGSRSKDVELDNKQRPSYAQIIEKSIKKIRSKGSISVDIKSSLHMKDSGFKKAKRQCDKREVNNCKQNNMGRSGEYRKSNGTEGDEIEIQIENSQDLKSGEQQMKIEQF